MLPPGDVYKRQMYPRVTTVGQNILQRGEKAGELILKIISGQHVEKENYMDFQIIKRDTTR